MFKSMKQKFIFIKRKASLFTVSIIVFAIFTVLLLLGDSFQRLRRRGAYFGEEKGSTEKQEVSVADSSSDPFRTAWVTYLSGNDENYVRGTLSLYGSLRRHLEAFNDKFVVIVVCSEVQKAGEETFSNLNITVQHYCNEFPEASFQNPVVNWSSMRKLHVLRLKAFFDRIIYVDTDINFLSDPSILKTHTAKPGFYAVTSQMYSDRFNAGVFVLTGDFNFDLIDMELSAAISCRTNCSIYVDKLSKKFGDQGFLNVIYSSSWKPLPDKLNVKAMFYMKGYVWGRKKAMLVRENTVGLHWIGPSKPWHANMLLPCGNTKKYCSCSKKESSMLKKMLLEWWQNYYFALELSSRISKVQKLDSKMILQNFDPSKVEVLLKKHLSAKKRQCPILQ